MIEQEAPVVDPPPSMAHEARPVATKPAGTPGRSWLPMALVGLVLLGGGAAGWFYAMGPGKAPEGGRAMAKEGPHGAETDGDAKSAPNGGLPVEVAHPHQGGIERATTQSGSVHAYEHAQLYSKVSGYLKVQNVDIGDRVKLGQLLAVIEDPEVDKAVDQNKASLDQALAMVKVGEAKIRSAEAAQAAAEAMVTHAETDVEAKQSNLDLQEKQLRRIADLVRREAIEEKLQDEQQDRREVAKSDVGVARAGVVSAKAQVQDRAARIQEAQADLIDARAKVEVGRANLDKAKVMQQYTRITSPYDGVVTVRSFHRGDFIRSASEGGNVPVLAVARTDLMRVVLPVPDIDVPYVDKGDKAVLRLVALPGQAFEGVVSRFSETEDPGSRNMRTEVDLPNPDGKLREGMYGPLTIILQAAAPKSVTIPSSGLITQSGKGEGTVMVARDGKAHKVHVHVTRDTGVQAEIAQGLTAKDMVITSYNGSLEEGTAIKAEEKKAAQEGSH